MTREEAIEAIRTAVTQWDRYSVPDDVEQALTTLAPAVRYEPPSVEEVGDGDSLWVWDDISRLWTLICGRDARSLWGLHWPAHLTAWLPYSAIPEGGA